MATKDIVFNELFAAESQSDDKKGRKNEEESNG